MNKRRFYPALFSILLVAFLILACAKPSQTPASQVQPTPEPEGVSFVIYGRPADQPVRIHTDMQTEILRDTYKKLHKAQGAKEISQPYPLTLDWTDWAKSLQNPADFVIVLTEQTDTSESRRFETTGTTLEITNLKLNTAYTWTVTAKTSSGEVTGDKSTFQTVDTIIRNLSVDGVANVRDLGGYHTIDGKTIRQGMLIRCGRLNKSRTQEVMLDITDSGIKTMLDELHIRTEIDLRRTDNGEVGGIQSSVLGDAVHYYSVPMENAPSENNGDALLYNAEMLRYLFEILSDESNYPIIFHCDIGTDRTGMVALLINGMLGVDEEDLGHDYVFSNLAKIGGFRSYDRWIEQPYMKHILNQPGETLQEKIIASLLEIGVTEDQMNAIRQIMLEK